MASSLWKAEWAGSWNETACGGCINNPTWRNNPQVFVKIQTETNLGIVLRQKAIEGTDLFGVGFYVCKSDGTINRQITITRKDVLAKSEFEDSEEVELKVLLKPLEVPYVVVICTFFPKEMSDFTIHFSGDQPFSLLTPRDAWIVTPLKGQWTKDSAAGSKSLESVLLNPQFLVAPSQTTQCKFLLMQAKKTFNPIGLSVIQTNSPISARLEEVRSDEIVGKSEFSSHRESLLDTTLYSDSTYVIVPYTSDPGHEGDFELLMYSTGAVNVKELTHQNRITIQGEWAPDSSGGCLNNITWRNNPQFQLKLNEKRPLNLRLRRKSADSDQQMLGIYVVKGQENGRCLMLSKSELVARATFEATNQANLECCLEPMERPYIVIPSTFAGASFGQFELTVYSSDNADGFTITQLQKVESNTFSRVIKSSWKDNSAGGCRNHSTWIYNPQFLLRSGVSGKVTVVLSQMSDEWTEIGFYVFEASSEVSTRLTKLLKANVKGQTLYQPDQEVGLELDVEAGMNYVILPSTLTAGVERDFHLGVFADHDDITLQEL